MPEYRVIAPFLVAFFVTLAATPFTIKLANKYKLVDNPTNRPHPAHIQDRTVPRAGGVPIYLGILFAILIFIPLEKHLIGILLGALVLLIMGLLDDKLPNFSPYKRLFLQFFAVAIVVASGVGISFISNPLGGLIHLDSIIIPINFLGPHRIILFADILAFFWIVWVMNIINFSKGVDGQMPGIVLVAALTIGTLSLKLFSHGDPNQLTIAILSFITGGAALGFLFFNWHPAKIFPGFSSSNIFGFMIAVLSILSGAKVATALLVLLIPAVDFIYLVLARSLRGQSPMLGDANHLHHRLLVLGWSHQKISLFYISTCAILGTLAAILPNEQKSFAVIGIGAVTFGTILWLQRYLQNHTFLGQR
jgi:UDP-GlcNAc:undecaprenyl-phosphate/decaprenyl-phosphate GlcNAc-1-phosphate transferase